MYNYQRSMDPILVNQQQPFPLPPPLPIMMDPFVMMHWQFSMSQAYAMPAYYHHDGGFSESSFRISAGPVTPPVYQGMAPGHHWQPQHQYQRAPSSGPSRARQHRRSSKAEPPYHYHLTHESSGTIGEDRSTGVYPGHAQIGTSRNKSGIGKVWRTPSKNPLIVECDLIT